MNHAVRWIWFAVADCLLVLSLVAGCASDDDETPGDETNDDAGPDEDADDDLVDDDVDDDAADDDGADDDTLDDDATDDDALDDDTLDDDTTDDDVDDDTLDDDTTDDDTTDDDTSIDWPDTCEDPQAMVGDACDYGVFQIYCLFGAPIITGDHVFGQLEAADQCRAGSPPPWNDMETCLDENIFDMFAVWISGFIQCMSAAGHASPFLSRFNPATWTPPYPAAWDHTASALNFWTYWEQDTIHEVSGAFTDLAGNGIHASFAWGEIGYGWLWSAFARGESTVFNSNLLEIPMDGWVVGVFAYWPIYFPVQQTLTWTN